MEGHGLFFKQTCKTSLFNAFVCMKKSLYYFSVICDLSISDFVKSKNDNKNSVNLHNYHNGSGRNGGILSLEYTQLHKRSR